MEEGKKIAESRSGKVGTFLSEVRLESSPSAIGFSDSCPCCGNKKRRCLQPASFFRKKLLVLDSANPDPTASLSLTPSPPPFRYLCSDPISPMSPPPPPKTPTIDPPPAAAASPAAGPPEENLERSNSTLTALSAEEKAVVCTALEEKRKVSLKDGEHAAEEEEEEEVRVCVRCRCGVVRRILLVR